MRPIGTPYNSGNQLVSNSTGNRIIQPTGANWTVTQEMIAKLQRFRQLRREANQLRRELRLAWEQGAAVEPGPLAFRMDSYESRTATWPALEAIFKDDVEWIKSLIPPRTSQRLVIYERSSA